MRTVLVSQDIKLRYLCRETLSEVHGDRCELVLSDGTEPVPCADLHIWDFHAGLNLPEWISDEEPRNHIFLVSGKDLNSFSDAHAGGGIIVLKPLGRALLRTFVDQAAIQHQTSQLRADRDALLQYLMQANLKLQEYDQKRTKVRGRAGPRAS